MTPDQQIILAKLNQGEALADICQGNNMPTVQEVIHWAETDGDFSANLACIEAR